MGWVLLAIGAASVAGAAAVLRRDTRVRRNPRIVAYRQPARAGRRERPHRDLAHYRASGALPRWDP